MVLQMIGFALARGFQAGAKPVPGLPAAARYDLQGEVTAIGQDAFPFPSKYSGSNTFPSRGSTTATEVGTVYLGFRPRQNVEVYLNPEFAWGAAPGAGDGIAGYPNADLIGQQALSGVPYIARAFARWRIPLRQGADQPVGNESVGRAPNLIAGKVPPHRIVVTAGKFAVSDVFDVNSYANNQRTQFINKAFVNNLAYDFAQDVRGYDFGASVALMNPKYSVRVGSFAVPTTPGSTGVTYGALSHGDQGEVDLYPQVTRSLKTPLALRLLAFRNVGFMGSYGDALAAQQSNMVPDLGSVRIDGAVRSGFGLNLEQALGDDGATGFFARAGWADGNVEAESYAEADIAYSIGFQLAGNHWRRPADNIGLAVGQSGISETHQQYLSAGGLGLNLGDGALRYGAETVFEGYYLYQATKALQVSADFQLISNPGYNRDRGPAPILSFRLRYAF